MPHLAIGSEYSQHHEVAAVNHSTSTFQESPLKEPTELTSPEVTISNTETKGSKEGNKGGKAGKQKPKRTFKQMAVREAIKISILLMIISPLVMFQFTRQLLFFPDTTNYDLKDPFKFIESKLKAKVEDVSFPSVNGEKLNALIFTREGAKKIFLMSHGNAGNVAHRLPQVVHFLNMGMSVLVYDYQGYGKSGGEPSVAGILNDGVAAYDYLRSHGWKANQIVVYGESLGCAVSCQIAKQREVAGIILQSGFSSLPSAARDRFVWLNLYPDFTFPNPQLNNCTILAAQHAPLLIIHGVKDFILPVKYGDEMYAKAIQPKRIVKLAHSGHNDLLSQDLNEYVACLSSFVKELK